MGTQAVNHPSVSTSTSLVTKTITFLWVTSCWNKEKRVKQTKDRGSTGTRKEKKNFEYVQDVTTMHTTHVKHKDVKHIRWACWRGKCNREEEGCYLPDDWFCCRFLQKKKNSSLCLFLQPTFQTSWACPMGSQAFCHLGPHLWNSLQQDQHNSSALSLFKSGLNLNFFFYYYHSYYYYYIVVIGFSLTSAVLPSWMLSNVAVIPNILVHMNFFDNYLHHREKLSLKYQHSLIFFFWLCISSPMLDSCSSPPHCNTISGSDVVMLLTMIYTLMGTN